MAALTGSQFFTAAAGTQVPLQDLLDDYLNDDLVIKLKTTEDSILKVKGLEFFNLVTPWLRDSIVSNTHADAKE